MTTQLPLETVLRGDVKSILSALLPYASESSDVAALNRNLREVEIELEGLNKRLQILNNSIAELEKFETPSLDVDPKFLGEKLQELKATRTLVLLVSERLRKRNIYHDRLVGAIKRVSREWGDVKSFNRPHGLPTTDYAKLNTGQRVQYDKWLKNQTTGQALYRSFITTNL